MEFIYSAEEDLDFEWFLNEGLQPAMDAWLTINGKWLAYCHRRNDEFIELTYRSLSSLIDTLAGRSGFEELKVDIQDKQIDFAFDNRHITVFPHPLFNCVDNGQLNRIIYDSVTVILCYEGMCTDKTEYKQRHTDIPGIRLDILGDVHGNHYINTNIPLFHVSGQAIINASDREVYYNEYWQSMIENCGELYFQNKELTLTGDIEHIVVPPSFKTV